jgi:hypothetical protein
LAKKAGWSVAVSTRPPPPADHPIWLIDIFTDLVQIGAKGCPVAKAQKKSFTVFVNAGDYKSLRSIADSHRPTINLPLGVSIKNLLDRYAAWQLTFSLNG